MWETSSTDDRILFLNNEYFCIPISLQERFNSVRLF